MNQNLGQNLIYKERNFFERISRINYGIPFCLIILGSTGVLMLFSVSGGVYNDLVFNHIIRLLISFFFFYKFQNSKNNFSTDIFLDSDDAILVIFFRY